MRTVPQPSTQVAPRMPQTVSWAISPTLRQVIPTRVAVALQLAALLLTLLPAGLALAHDPQYVDELEIVSSETWLYNAIGDGIAKGASATTSEVLSNVGKTVLGGFLDSYVPGLSSILGLGGGDPGTQRVLDAIRSSSVQLAARMRRLDKLVAAGQSTQIDASYAAGQTMLEGFVALETAESKLTNIDLLSEAEAALQGARFMIEAQLFNAPDRLRALEYLHTHVVLGALIGSLIAERAAITSIAEAKTRAEFSGTADDFMLTLSAAEQEELSSDISTLTQNLMRAELDGTHSLFGFYRSVADNGILRAEVESWFSPLTHPTRCWDDQYDASFDLPEYYQDESNWNERCCDVGWTEWPVTERCVGFADIFWYYYVKAPKFNCYRRPYALYDVEDAEACNRFFVRDPGSVILASYDNYVFYAHDSELGAVEDHKSDVYDAFVARIYGPVAIYLDSLWSALGHVAARPRNGLDADLDYKVVDVPGLPEASGPYRLPAALNFKRFPAWSSAVFQSIAR